MTSEIHVYSRGTFGDVPFVVGTNGSNRTYLQTNSAPSTPLCGRLAKKDPVIAKHEEQSDLGLGIVLNLIMCRCFPGVSLH
jgi:hypothetical protein